MWSTFMLYLFAFKNLRDIKICIDIEIKISLVKHTSYNFSN